MLILLGHCSWRVCGNREHDLEAQLRAPLCEPFGAFSGSFGWVLASQVTTGAFQLEGESQKKESKDKKRGGLNIS